MQCLTKTALRMDEPAALVELKKGEMSYTPTLKKEEGKEGKIDLLTLTLTFSNELLLSC